jgi:hypothetical protein
MTINSQHSTETPDNQQQTTITEKYTRKTKQTRQQARVKTSIFAGKHLTFYVLAKSKIIADFHGQNLRSTPGQAEPIAQYFFENSTAGVCDISELEYAINGFIA